MNEFESWHNEVIGKNTVSALVKKELPLHDESWRPDRTKNELFL